MLRKGIGFVLALLTALVLVGCATSPEDGRPQGAGLHSGADVGNVSSEFKPRSKVFTGDDPDQRSLN